jgi:hypothetical protein
MWKIKWFKHIIAVSSTATSTTNRLFQDKKSFLKMFMLYLILKANISIIIAYINIAYLWVLIQCKWIFMSWNYRYIYINMCKLETYLFQVKKNGTGKHNILRTQNYIICIICILYTYIMYMPKVHSFNNL